ncbi:unnamed protein product [Lactuca virosa]|uniref:Uncharacterized protein n=1 Tax=Lactuca virosa TaxID=75947 RepID=A0AAU9LTG8_9ASTR|nr:unnamed protein product [Lactuca virosa]
MIHDCNFGWCAEIDLVNLVKKTLIPMVRLKTTKYLHFLIQKKLWGHDPAHHELFLYTHAKNHDGVTFLVDKAKKIHDDCMERCDRLEAIGEEIDEDKLFYDVVGGHDRKKRLYGFGSYGTHIRSSKGSSETHREQYEDNNVETKVEIENLKK